jgi:hypothetical protein
MTPAWIGALLIFLIMVYSCELKKDVFCKPRRHERYIEQFGQCKKCDRCPPGWGYDNKVRYRHFFNVKKCYVYVMYLFVHQHKISAKATL